MRSLLVGFGLFVFTAVGCGSQGPTLRSKFHDDMESFNAAKSPEFSAPELHAAQMKAFQEQRQQQAQQHGHSHAAPPGQKERTSLFGD